ncbi:hypothetical protein ACFY7F_28535 [Streptomyces griseofuscus]|uniref:TRADD-N-associated membrane domain-containing protein n=1 Tax=Streptomyces griseofuscus TaxID=146922 RepID=UPI0033C38B9B
MAGTDHETDEEAAAPSPTTAHQLVRRLRTPLVASLGIVISVVLAYAAWTLLEGNGPAYDNPERNAWLDTATTTAAVLLGMSGVIFSVLWAASRSFTSEAESARQRVEDPDSTVHLYGSHSQVYIQPRETRSEHGGTAVLLEPDAQASMLTQIYSHGLAQAKVSFFVSIVFGMVGSAVLLTGVGLAIGHADSNGSRYAAIVTQTAGAVINLLAGVFFLQSNRTRRDMGAQGVMLRDDSRFDRRLKAASVLSDNISDEPLRNQVRAEMALQLVGGQLDTSAADDREDTPSESAPADEALPGT